MQPARPGVLGTEEGKMHTCTEKTNWLPKTTTGLKEGVLALLKAVIPESYSTLSSECFINDLVFPSHRQLAII